ncbi:hypothetical protein CGLO_06350 [Colletotrichum gloeosporioides Cg-14]|uniref:Uncharacterized protein n=1 Tax=Colletotrichum gloeosporioides (strain Cg-14) TaxID=1237896 RepID=T0KPC4_COLGC|nr:hypothetical protein CGLO_06350 [Colletotrichum gloeosporioides Cg-14]
MVSAMTVSE